MEELIEMPDSSDEEDEEFFDLVAFFGASISLLASQEALKGAGGLQPGYKLGSSVIERERVPVNEIFGRLDERWFKKCYRMSKSLFWKLHSLLDPHMKQVSSKQRGPPPNGLISTAARLSMAIRWFAGGDAADIFQVHGVGYKEVYISVWQVVDAINICPDLQIVFPASHDEQKKIARGFRAKSRASFSNCVGCIDGMLVWTNKPNKNSARDAGFGEAKFFCGRKKKFGLALQAICDHKRRFLDVEVGHPASTSDYLCFTTSEIHLKLREKGFLADGLCLYGDNAYVNTPFMATPYKGAQSGVKDAYNFYHSQLRINIECAFGILVHRWGVLRKAIPVNVSVHKTAQLTRALCMLHNFCADGNELIASSASASDSLATAAAGGFSHGNPESRPDPLSGSGHHWDGVSRSERREFERHQGLPRELMVSHLEKRNQTSRPKPRGSTSTNNFNFNK